MIPNVFLTRMNKELAALEHDPPPHIVCYPCEDNITQLNAYFHGPPGTPYESGLFRLDVTVPETYPFDPPLIRFVTPIYHPNIDDSGRICANVLKKGKDDQWKPSMNLRTTLLSLHALMGNPNPDDPLDADIAREYQQDYELFIKKAKEHTMTHAVEDPGKVTPESSATSDIKAVCSSKALDDNATVDNTSSTVISPETSLSNITSNDKPKRVSKLSLSRKKATGSLSPASSQHSTNELAQPSAVSYGEDKTQNILQETAILGSDIRHGINDSQCEGSNDSQRRISNELQSELPNNIQSGKSNAIHCERSKDSQREGSSNGQGGGSNDKAGTMQQQTRDDRTNESGSNYDKSNKKRNHEHGSDDEKQQNDKKKNVEKQMHNIIVGLQNTHRDNDAELSKGPLNSGCDGGEQQVRPSLSNMINSSKITKATNIEKVSLLPIKETLASPQSTSIRELHTGIEPSTSLNNWFFNDDDVLSDLSSTLNSESVATPKRKRNKISLSCKKKPKTA